MAPIDGELLSSFLIRNAHAHGSSAYRFFSYHLPGVPLWYRDLDRSVSDPVLTRLADFTGMSVDRLISMTLRSYELKFNCNSESESNRYSAICPWINTIGIYHTVRRRFGLQFCPECLKAGPAFKKSWRMAYTTICPIHNQTLLDACPHCGAALAPHRNHVSLAHCHVCYRLLYQTTNLQPEPGVVSRLQAAQNWLSGKNFAGISEVAFTGGDFLAGCHSLLAMLRQHAIHCRNAHLLEAGSGPLELLRSSERRQVLLFLHQLLAQWPSHFRSLAVDTGLNQLSAKDRSFPPWIQVEINILPEGVPKPRKIQKSPLINELRSVQRQKPKDWRTRRAELLLKMVRSRQ